MSKIYILGHAANKFVYTLPRDFEYFVKNVRRNKNILIKCCPFSFSFQTVKDTAPRVLSQFNPNTLYAFMNTEAHEIAIKHHIPIKRVHFLCHKQ